MKIVVRYVVVFNWVLKVVFPCAYWFATSFLTEPTGSWLLIKNNHLLTFFEAECNFLPPSLSPYLHICVAATETEINAHVQKPQRENT